MDQLQRIKRGELSKRTLGLLITGVNIIYFMRKWSEKGEINVSR